MYFAWHVVNLIVEEELNLAEARRRRFFAGRADRGYPTKRIVYRERPIKPLKGGDRKIRRPNLRVLFR